MFEKDIVNFYIIILKKMIIMCVFLPYQSPTMCLVAKKYCCLNGFLKKEVIEYSYISIMLRHRMCAIFFVPRDTWPIIKWQKTQRASCQKIL